MCACVLTLAGCEVAALATAASVAGGAVTAISTGSDIYQYGKLDSVEMVRPRELIDATILAASDLGLQVRETKLLDKDKFSLLLADDRDTTIEVIIEQRAASMSRTRVNVGFFGSEPTARLVMHRIRQHLPAWPPARPIVGTTQPSPQLVMPPTDSEPDDVSLSGRPHS